MENILEQLQLPTGSYGYTAMSLEDERIGATEYTLVTIVVDVSGSVDRFRDELQSAIQEIVRSCDKSPKKDNLMIRLLSFNTSIQEIHGFKLLADCDANDYVGCLDIGGRTSLYDASLNAIEATIDYAVRLGDNDFDANAIVIVITDGEDNASTNASPQDIQNVLAGVVKEESLESLITILVGIETAQELDYFFNNSGFSDFIKIDDANEKTMSRLAQFVSKSISAQSQALGTGSASQSLVF